MLRMLGRMSLASTLILAGTSSLFAQGAFILGADDWTDWGGVDLALGPFSGVTINESEVNDDSAAANAMAIGDDFAGSIDGVGLDEDYVAFSALAGDAISAATVAVGGLGDTQLTLYDTDGVTVLAFDDDGGPGTLSLIKYTFSTGGTYFLKIGSYVTGMGAYSMELRLDGVLGAVDSWVYIQKALEAVAPGVTRAGHDGSVAVLGAADSIATQRDAGAAYHYCVPLAAANVNLSGVVSFHDGVVGLATFFAGLSSGAVNPQIIVLAGSGSANDLDAAEAARLAVDAAALAAYINSGGGLISHGDDNWATNMAYDWLPALIPGVSVTLVSNSPVLTHEGRFNLPAMDEVDHHVDADGYFSDHGLDVFLTAPGSPVTEPGTGVTVSESEGNDDFTAANPINVGDDAAGSIDNGGADADYFSFGVNAGDLVSFETVSGGSLGDTRLSLYDTDGVTLLADDDDGAGNLKSLIDYTFSAPGTYFVAVESFGGETGSYTMEIRSRTAGPDEDVIVGRLPSAWNWLGNDLAGVAGQPLVIPAGPLAAGSAWTLSLTNAAPGTTAFLVLGLSPLNAPFKGGVLVPSPDLNFPLATNGNGELSFGINMGPNTPPGTSFYIQYWIIDAAGPAGFSASNGFSGTTP